MPQNKQDFLKLKDGSNQLKEKFYFKCILYIFEFCTHLWICSSIFFLHSLIFVANIYLLTSKHWYSISPSLMKTWFLLRSLIYYLRNLFECGSPSRAFCFSFSLFQIHRPILLEDVSQRGIVCCHNSSFSPSLCCLLHFLILFCYISISCLPKRTLSLPYHVGKTCRQDLIKKTYLQVSVLYLH